MAFRFERLRAWHRALELSGQAISVAPRWPQAMRSSLGNRVRRAAVSIVTNIAEGSDGREVGGEM